MRKSLTTLGIAVLLVIGWMVGDDDATPSEPEVATPQTSAAEHPDDGSSGNAAPTADPATPEPTAQDGQDPEPDTSEAEPNPLTEEVAALTVSDDDRGGYDREEFGDYDRDALLEASMRDHGCYLSLADDQCYDDAGEVHADHIVALAEAWRSGLAESDTDAIAEDPDNLWLLTASVNISKSDGDPTEWLPPDENAVCTYIAAYVDIKIEYSLTVDPAEHDTLVDTAANC